MSNTLATVSVSPQNNPMRKGIKVGVIILSALMKRPRLRELVIGQGQKVTNSAPGLRSSEFQVQLFFCYKSAICWPEQEGPD